MRAATVRAHGGPEAVAPAEWPDPVPGAGEALIQVEAAEVNFPDLLHVAGTYQVKAPLPFIPGVLAVGRVLASPDHAPGTRVVASMDRGAFAEKAVARLSGIAPVPEGVAPAEAAALGLAAQTAFFALAERARLAPGESVLVLGASGAVGAAAVGIAKAMGAARVVAAVRSDAAASLARDAGADHVIQPAAPWRDGLRAALAEAGGPVDVVLDPLGGDATEAALRTLAWCGRLVVVGFAAGAPFRIPANHLLVKNIAVLGLQWTDYRERRPDAVRDAWARIFAWRRAGMLRPRIGATFPLDDAAGALRRVQSGLGAARTVIAVG